MFFGFIIRKEAADNVVAFDEISGGTGRGRTTEMRFDGLRQWHRGVLPIWLIQNTTDPDQFREVNVYVIWQGTMWYDGDGGNGGGSNGGGNGKGDGNE